MMAEPFGFLAQYSARPGFGVSDTYDTASAVKIYSKSYARSFDASPRRGPKPETLAMASVTLESRFIIPDLFRNRFNADPSGG